MNKRSLWRLFFVYSCAVVFVVIILMAMMRRAFWADTKDLFHIQLQGEAKVMALALAPPVADNQYDVIKEDAARFSRETGVRVTVMDPYGYVLAESHDEGQNIKRYDDCEEVLMARQGAIGYVLRESMVFKKPMMFVAVPIKHNGDLVGIVRTSVLMDEVAHWGQRVQRWIWLAALLIVAGSLLLTWVAVKMLFSPLLRLSRELAQIKNDLSPTDKALAAVQELWEADRVRTTFENLSLTIEDQKHQLEQQRHDWDMLMAVMVESFCVFNAEGKVVLCNAAFADIFGAGLENKFYWGFIQQRELKEKLDLAYQQQQSSVCEISCYGKVWRCFVQGVKHFHEVVVVMRDVSVESQWEQLKKDFVANVSHELKTPLTAIQGFTETLKDMETDEQKKHYLDIIERHAQRLTAIVSELLVLSQTEQESAHVPKESVDINEVLTHVCESFQQRAKDKQLALVLEHVDGAACIVGNRFQLEQVFINLIDNALKYTEKGSVTVKVEKKPQHILITVEDTGIGIPEKDLSRIFERFYRVDSSRSRREGGIGLGLSIVKHIVMSHGAEITVRSERGQGTRFVLYFPCM